MKKDNYSEGKALRSFILGEASYYGQEHDDSYEDDSYEDDFDENEMKKAVLSDNILKDYEYRANAEREAGGSVEINYHLPYVAVTLSDGSEFFFQGEEASDLLDEVPENIDDEDYILIRAQGW